MIDLTPLDVRNKRGDFRKAMRGYEPQEVDVFLEMVAERLEALVRENLQLRERTQTLQDQVNASTGREQAVQDALVTAQELRADIRAQSQREADHALREAEVEARRLMAEADEVVRDRLRGIERQIDQSGRAVEELERRRKRFLQEFRTLLERELDVVHVEEDRAPLEERAIDLDLGSSRATEVFDHEAADELVPPGGVSGAIAAGSPPTEASADEPPSAAEPDSAEEPSSADSVSSADEDSPPDAASSAEVLSPEDVRAHQEARDGGHPEYREGPEEPGVWRPVDVDALPPLDAGRSMGETGLGDADADVGVDDVEGAPNGVDTFDDAAPGHAPDPIASVDVSELRPASGTARPPAPAPDVGSEPSALELELIAGASREVIPPAPRTAEGDDEFEGIPDLETVLAEAGVEDATPPPSIEEIAPPPVRPDDPVLLFDPDDEDPFRR